MSNSKKDKQEDCCGANDKKVIPKQQEIHTDNDGHDHGTVEEAGWKSHWPLLLSLVILAIMLTLEFGFNYKSPFPFDLIIFYCSIFACRLQCAIHGIQEGKTI